MGGISFIKNSRKRAKEMTELGKNKTKHHFAIHNKITDSRIWSSKPFSEINEGFTVEEPIITDQS